MGLIQLEDKWVNLNLVTYFSTDDQNAIKDDKYGVYNRRLGRSKPEDSKRVIVRFAGSAANHIVLTREQARDFQNIIIGYQMNWVKLDRKWINIDLVAMVSTTEYQSTRDRRVVIRFSGEVASQLILTHDDSTQFLKQLQKNNSN